MSEVNELVEFYKIAAGMADIQEKGNFLPDMSTKEGYEASKRFVLDITTPTRTKLDKAHKTAKQYWKVGGQNVDKKKNEIMDLLVDIQKPHQEAYKEFDQIAKDKKLKFEADIQDKINGFYDFKFLVDINVTTSDEMASIINSCGETDTVSGFYHRQKDAEAAKHETMIILNDCLMSIVSRETETKRQEDLAEENRLRQIQIDEQQEAMRLQQEEMDRKQEEFDRVENEAAAKAQHEADEKQRLIDEANRAEQEKQQAIEREEYAKQQSELAADQAREDEAQRQYNERIEKEAAAAKREANKAHNRKINRAIVKVLVDNGISEDDAIKMVTLAAQKQLPQLTINY